MSKSVEELHNHEDATSLMDGLRFYFGLIFILALLGVVFWSAF